MFLESYSERFGWSSRSALRCMRCLIGFETVYLAFTDVCLAGMTEKMVEGVFDSRRYSLPDETLGTCREVDGRVLNAYQVARKALEFTLGPAQLICDGKGIYLEFRPRSYKGGEIESGDI